MARMFAMSTNNTSNSVSTDSTHVRQTASTRYSPLLHNGDSFRLLRVLPSLRQGSPLRCELYTSSISRERDKYIAGSYVWGPPEPTMSILVNGEHFQVRDNLFRFLKAFRSRYQPQVIWLDAICINQDDVQERSHQVQEMKRIYSGAKCVYSWLGYDKPLPHSGMFNRQYMIDLYYRCMRDERQHARRKHRLEYISKAEYWSRMWIVQEFMLAQDMRLLLGRDKISYSKLKKIMLDGFLFDGWTETTKSKEDMFVLIKDRDVVQRTFEALFENYGMLQRSVPLDGIFALLGLLGDSEEDLRLISIIDYSLTVWQLLQQILALNILKSSPFKFIEQYNRCVIKGRRDDYMGVYFSLELGKLQSWQPYVADDSRYTRAGGSPLQMDPDIRALRVIRYCEATSDDTVEIEMYTPEGRTVSRPSTASVRLSLSFDLPMFLQPLETCALVEACDSRCTTACVSHAVIGFSWTFWHYSRGPNEPAPIISIDVPLLASHAPWYVSQLIHNIQQRSMEMVEAIISKVRMTANDRSSFHKSETPYKLETDVETMVTLSTFIRDLETHHGWQGLLELARNQLRKIRN